MRPIFVGGSLSFFWAGVYELRQFPSISTAIACFGVGWTFAAPLLLIDGKVPASIGKTGRALFIVCPVLLAILAQRATHSAEDMLSGRTPHWEIAFKVGGGVEKLRLNGMRRFSTFVILVDEKRVVRIVPSDSVLSSVQDLPTPPSPPFWCALAKGLCEDDTLAVKADKPSVTLPKSSASNPLASTVEVKK